MDEHEQRLKRQAATPEQASPNQEAGQSQQDPTVRTGEAPVSGQTIPSSGEGGAVPPASEAWVEGQATSEADYANPEKGPDR